MKDGASHGRKRGAIDQATDDTLTPAQETALCELLAGASVTKAAEVAGVSRQTCSEWKNHDPVFRAAMNASRLDVWSHVEDRLRALVGKSLDVLEADLDAGNVDTAKALLAAASALNLSTIGSSNPVTVARILDDQREAEAFTHLMAGLDDVPLAEMAPLPPFDLAWED